MRNPKAAVVPRAKSLLSATGRGIATLLRFLPTALVVAIKEHLTPVSRLDYSRGRVELHMDTLVEYFTRRRSCRKEPETVHWIESCFRAGDVFFDIGANVGAYSLVASRYWTDAIQVYAFEPGATSYGQLCRNIVLNGFERTVVPLPIALGAAQTIEDFQYVTMESGAALHALGSGSQSGSEPTYSCYHRTIVSRLDDLIESYGLPWPNHVKIDVDGAELNILDGAPRTLSSPNLRSLLIECSTTGDGRLVVDHMRDKGFEVSAVHEHKGGSNVIFQRTATVASTPQAGRTFSAIGSESVDGE